MAHLSLFLLGAFQAKLDGERITGFESAKARALLAYLAVEADRPHRRESLAGLLWPDRPDRTARTNLRHTLSALRTAIGDRDTAPPFLSITRATIQFNKASDYWLDVEAFRALAEASPESRSTTRPLEEAVAFYRGSFLEGFSVGDSPAFEDWSLLTREHLERQVSIALDRLAGGCEQRGEYEKACQYAHRRTEFEPWHEEAHQQLMRLLALGGQRSAALAQYGTCCQALVEELGVQPTEETTALYEQIRNGEIGPRTHQAQENEISSLPTAGFYEPASAPQPTSDVPASRARTAQPPEWTGTGGEGLEGERRVVTALAAVVALSAMRGKSPDAEMRAKVMHHMLPILTSAIDRYGGEVCRYWDDGLIALFGASVAHEDDPERAVLAALEMRDAVRPYVASLDGRERIALSLKVGVNTGYVIADTTADRTWYWEASATERALALATSRSIPSKAEGHEEAVSEPVTVQVAENTHSLVEQLFEWETRDERAGGEGEHIAYRPQRHQALFDKGRGIEGLSSPLVGRENEFRALQDSVERLRDGVGGIVTVVGEAGIGKSRLVAEVRATAEVVREPPPQWIEGRCLSYATSVAYQVWVDALRGLLNLGADAPPQAAAEALREQVHALCSDRADEVYPFLARMMSLPLTGSAEARLHGVESEGLQVLTFRAVEMLLERAAEQAPLVVVCEDLHWADATSVELLQRLLALTDRAPILWICVFRPKTEHGCWQIKEAAAHRYAHRHTDLQLGTLSTDESIQLIGSLLHGRALPRALRTRILDRAAGNPFYVEEILRSLMDRGVFAYDESVEHWQVAEDVSGIALPDTLHGMLAARIDLLPQGAKRVLQLAAVIGRFFAYPLLAAIAEQGRLDEHLAALQRAQMIRERARVPELAYGFRHVLIQEAAYKGLLRRARRLLHRRVAEVQERLYADRIEEQLSLLAYHWEQAGETEKAVAYLRRAGEQAAVQYANDEAIGYLSHALDLAPEEKAGRYDLLLARAKMYGRQGAREAQHQDLNELKRVAQVLNDGQRQGIRRLAEVVLLEADYALMTSDYLLAIASAQSATELAQTAGDLAIEAMGHLTLGQAYQSRDFQFKAAWTQLERAAKLARAASLSGTEAQSLRELGTICFLQRKDCMDAKSYLEQALLLYQESGNRLGEGKTLNAIGWVCVYQDDLSAARDYLERGLSICGATGNRYDEGWSHFHLGQLALVQGDEASAIDHLERSVRILGETEARFGQGWALKDLGLAYMHVGAQRETWSYLEQHMRIAREIGDRGFEARNLALRTLAAHLDGDPERAWEYGQQALHAARELGLTRLQAQVLTFLGHALVSLGRFVQAIDMYRSALALWRELDPHSLAVEPLAGLANACLAQGNLSQSQAYAKEVLNYLETHPLDGTGVTSDIYVPYEIHTPFGAYLTCYRVLVASEDPGARDVLTLGYHLLQDRAAKISDEELRRSFLENVSVHREIVKEWLDAQVARTGLNPERT